MTKLRLKRHGTFHIRDGWMEKALNAINENNDGKSIFRKEVGVANLGIGSMMVTSLRYWMIASEIINEKDSQLTDFGRLLIEYDRYLDEGFSWWMIHLHLVSNFSDSPVFNVVFNHYKKGTFYKDDLVNYFYDYFKDVLSNEYGVPSEEYIDSDVSVLINTYYGVKITNPEDNLQSPLTKLNLLKRNNEDKYYFSSPRRDSLPYLVVYYCLLKALNGKDSINIDDLLELENNPGNIFCLDKNVLYLYLNEMKENGLITINKTAGLNMIYIQRTLTEAEIFEMFFEEGN